MGLNVTLYRILSIEKEEGWGGQLYDYVKTECIEWFDHCRYSGDKEFFGREGKLYSVDSDGEYERPKDIDESIEWIKQNVHEGNQPRLIKALELMKEDENIVFHRSY